MQRSAYLFSTTRCSDDFYAPRCRGRPCIPRSDRGYAGSCIYTSEIYLPRRWVNKGCCPARRTNDATISCKGGCSQIASFLPRLRARSKVLSLTHWGGRPPFSYSMLVRPRVGHRPRPPDDSCRGVRRLRPAPLRYRGPDSPAAWPEPSETERRCSVERRTPIWRG